MVSPPAINRLLRPHCGFPLRRSVVFPLGDNTKIGFTGGPLFTIVFLRRSLAFGLGFLRLALFSHVSAPLISLSSK